MKYAILALLFSGQWVMGAYVERWPNAIDDIEYFSRDGKFFASIYNLMDRDGKVLLTSQQGVFPIGDFKGIMTQDKDLQIFDLTGKLRGTFQAELTDWENASDFLLGQSGDTCILISSSGQQMGSAKGYCDKVALDGSWFIVRDKQYDIGNEYENESDPVVKTISDQTGQNSRPIEKGDFKVFSKAGNLLLIKRGSVVELRDGPGGLSKTYSGKLLDFSNAAGVFLIRSYKTGAIESYRDDGSLIGAFPSSSPCSYQLTSAGDRIVGACTNWRTVEFRELNGTLIETVEGTHDWDDKTSVFAVQLDGYSEDRTDIYSANGKWLRRIQARQKKSFDSYLVMEDGNEEFLIDKDGVEIYRTTNEIRHVASDGSWILVRISGAGDQVLDLK